MDAFESIVASILERDGYWVMKSVKVSLTEKERSVIGKSVPTPEIDLVAYCMTENMLILFEVKSYLDSTGVKFEDLVGRGKNKDRYRLLNNDKYRTVVSAKLRKDFVAKNLINSITKIRYGLAAGKVKNSDLSDIEKYVKAKRYYFYSPKKIMESVTNLQGAVYLNDSSTLTVKVLRPLLRKVTGPFKK